MTKIVYNACYGGFGLSNKARELYCTLSGVDPLEFYDSDLDRTDPILVQVVKELGSKADGRHANLQIRDLEPGTLYRIDEYDGWETVMTIADYEWKTA